MNHRDAEDAEERELNRLSHAVNGTAMEVHRMLGPGYLESVYEEALCVEFELRGIPFVRQYPVSVAYKGRAVGEARLDLLVDGKLVVELKAVEALQVIYKAQVISYLRATGCKFGLLINFNVIALRNGIQRVILTRS